MNIRTKNVLSCLVLRPWLIMPFGVWIVVSVIYYWWLISRISVLESQNNVYKTQLTLSHQAMKEISVEYTTTYQVPVIPDSIGTLCETIHIALVCMGKCTRLITPMFKSLLHNRQNPLHFHMVVDNTAEHTVAVLFDTWMLPDVKYTCYNAQNRLSEVRWIPNSHYSGVYALVKLLFPDILPENLDRIIVLDSDLTFLSDVAEIWRMFRNMTNEQINYSDLCVSFRSAQNIKLRTHLYYMDYSYNNIDDFDVTLVLQLSMDRLQFLERLVNHWEGPLSAAIYLSDCDVTKLESFTRDWSDTLSSRKNIGYHLVFKHDSVHYPVNYLRNVALENVNTPYVFLMDVDFVPMAGLYQHLRDAIRLINPYPQKKCLVVPAFETQRYRASVPRDKAALLARLAARHGAGDVAPFRTREWPRGHRATNYTRWMTATAPYEVEWESDYEPYLVVHRSVPKYDTRFSGFGWNKVSHSVELRATGHRALVLPAAFLVHTPHAPSPDITAFRADPHYRVCLALLKQEFMDDLSRKYNMTLGGPSKLDSVYLGQAKSLLLNQAKELP
ncbi:xylosyl- and glucuronyltransferase LARGE2s isoform X2 [Bombyx mori]|uniref:xylosyl- and glucuronyltransferase LARGE2s isoform X2 n=1 Tax=Bombyx mori TaxID=7091 RepID=UPI002ED13631